MIFRASLTIVKIMLNQHLYATFILISPPEGAMLTISDRHAHLFLLHLLC